MALSELKGFLSDALHMPMDLRDEPERRLVLPKIILGLAFIVTSLPVWWLMPEDSRDASLWWLIGVVALDVVGGFFIIAGIQIAADRHALRPGTWLNRLDYRVRHLFTSSKPSPAVNPTEPYQTVADEPLPARVANYLAAVDCAFQTVADRPGGFLIEARGKHCTLQLFLLASELTTSESFMVLARYPFKVLRSDTQQIMINLLNRINTKLAVGSLELHDGLIHVRYSIEWGGQLPKQAFNSALWRCIELADAAYPEIVAVLNDESDDDFFADTRPAEQPMTLQ